MIDDPTIAGEKAFNWKEQFAEVFAKGGFDVVVDAAVVVAYALTVGVPDIVANSADSAAAIAALAALEVA